MQIRVFNDALEKRMYSICNTVQQILFIISYIIAKFNNFTTTFNACHKNWHEDIEEKFLKNLENRVVKYIYFSSYVCKKN